MRIFIAKDLDWFYDRDDEFADPCTICGATFRLLTEGRFKKLRMCMERKAKDGTITEDEAANFADIERSYNVIR